MFSFLYRTGLLGILAWQWKPVELFTPRSPCSPVLLFRSRLSNENSHCRWRANSSAALGYSRSGEASAFHKAPGSASACTDKLCSTLSVFNAYNDIIIMCQIVMVHSNFRNAHFLPLPTSFAYLSVVWGKDLKLPLSSCSFERKSVPSPNKNSETTPLNAVTVWGATNWGPVKDREQNLSATLGSNAEAQTLSSKLPLGDST